MNVYVVQLSNTIKLEPCVHLGSKETSHVYVTASSFEKAISAVAVKYPQAVIRSVAMQNYTGVPIVCGE